MSRCKNCGHGRADHIYEEGACRPGFECPSRCKEYVAPSSDEALLAELEQAEESNVHGRECQVCRALPQMSESVRPGVEKALAGTIGEQKLADILTRNGYPTGRRAVKNHRSEGHSA